MSVPQRRVPTTYTLMYHNTAEYERLFMCVNRTHTSLFFVGCIRQNSSIARNWRLAFIDAECLLEVFLNILQVSTYAEREWCAYSSYTPALSVFIPGCARQNVDGW